MNIELLVLNEKHTDTPIEQTKTKPRGTLNLMLKKQIETFLFSPPKNLFEESKWL